MRTLSDLASILFTGALSQMGRSAGIVLPALAGAFSPALKSKNRKAEGKDIEPLPEAEGELPIMRCRRGTYEYFEIPRAR